MEEKNRQEKAAKWLMLLILFKSLLMAFWIGREYLYSQSYQCVVVFGDDHENSTHIKPPRFLVLSDQSGELLPPTSQLEPETLPYSRTTTKPETEINRDKRFLAHTSQKQLEIQKGRKKWVKKVVRRRRKKLPPSKRTVQDAEIRAEIESTVKIVPLRSLDEGVKRINTKTTQNRALALPNPFILKKKSRRVKKKKMGMLNSESAVIKKTEKRYLPSEEQQALFEGTEIKQQRAEKYPHPVSRTNDHLFTDQFEAFKLTVTCVGRSLLNLWCLAQCFAAIPFLIGICTKERCLFIPHLILDALFLVILFIYGITITVFSFILFALMDEMSVETLGIWLVVAAALDVVFAVYTLVFTLTLRCCELLLRKTDPYRKNRSKSLLYTEVASIETVENFSDDRLEETKPKLKPKPKPKPRPKRKSKPKPKPKRLLNITQP
uniref:Uncharacterized protein n=1 Tax=Ditylenchus dipsaci TaxID=166011 RepID=A0A915CR88_9BILA